MAVFGLLDVQDKSWTPLAPYFWRENLIGFECRYGPQLVVIVGLVLRILGINGLLSAFEWRCLVYRTSKINLGLLPKIYR
ncbi:MAG: hypothetical protein DRR08_03380 [Candidatus Parabeggiatoa sp. nov. 2]|nr:MAG: hypothetical protein B6247_20045 [Beggiatoa sp. 4572_84]RKZ63475.1 MAG: hypothetical protein DRR08_03380 [Gammaproteobacteria bacterium]